MLPKAHQLALAGETSNLSLRMLVGMSTAMLGFCLYSNVRLWHTPRTATGKVSAASGLPPHLSTHILPPLVYVFFPSVLGTSPCAAGLCGRPGSRPVRTRGCLWPSARHLPGLVHGR